MCHLQNNEKMATVNNFHVVDFRPPTVQCTRAIGRKAILQRHIPVAQNLFDVLFSKHVVQVVCGCLLSVGRTVFEAAKNVRCLHWTEVLKMSF